MAIKRGLSKSNSNIREHDAYRSDQCKREQRHNVCRRTKCFCANGYAGMNKRRRKRVIMKIRGVLVDMLVKLVLKNYKGFMVYEKG